MAGQDKGAVARMRLAAMPGKAARYFAAILAGLVLASLVLTGLVLAAGASALQAPPAKASPAKPAKKVSSSSSKKTSVTQKKRSRRKTRRRTVRRRVVRGQRAPTTQRIREIQQSLSRSGHYDGKLTGKLDSHTVAALSDFQQAQDLRRTGRLNALTLQKLEQYGLPPHSRASAAPPTRADP